MSDQRRLRCGRPRRDGRRPDAHLASLLEDSAEDLYENAPCGYLSTLPDGQIAKVNATLLGWLGYTREELVGRRRFSDLLTAGGRIYHETHFAPLLAMQGEIGGVALELKAADGTRLPVLVTSVVRTGATGEPLMIRTTVFDARDRRAYERELLRADAKPSSNASACSCWSPPCSAACCRPRCPTCRAWRRPPTTTPRPGTRSAATSTTCSPSTGTGGACSSATSAARARPPPP